MAAEKTGLAIGRLIRIPVVLLTLFLLFIIGKSSLNLITAFAVPFGFSPGRTTAFSTVAVIFFLSIAVLISFYIFKTDEPFEK